MRHAIATRLLVGKFGVIIVNVMTLLVRFRPSTNKSALGPNRVPVLVMVEEFVNVNLDGRVTVAKLNVPKAKKLVMNLE